LSSTYQERQRVTVSQRTSWSVLLFLIALGSVGIGVTVLFSGAWAAVAVGTMFAIYSYILVLPVKHHWG
jgi:membrane protein YdbS with pleckstrin-like domain